MTIVDLSREIVHQMPTFPGDAPVSLRQTACLARDQHNNHLLQMGMHSGTHIDGPMHMTGSGLYISDLGLDAFIGQGCLLDVRSQRQIVAKPEYREQIPENCILLLWTGMDQQYGRDSYFRDYPCVEAEFCELMIAKGITMLGMDSPSPDKHPFPVHKALLEHKILILENLTNLEKLQAASSFEVIALPLKIRADGAMTRAVARVRE